MEDSNATHPKITDIPSSRLPAPRRVDGDAEPELLPIHRSQPLPLSFGQERLWLLENIGGLGATYSVPQALLVTGDLNIEALETCLSRVVERHEVLRTRFEENGTRPVQVIEPPFQLRMPVEDLSSLSVSERDSAVQRRGYTIV